jgi:hypothetical protein
VEVEEDELPEQVVVSPKTYITNPITPRIINAHKNVNPDSVSMNFRNGRNGISFGKIIPLRPVKIIKQIPMMNSTIRLDTAIRKSFIKIYPLSYKFRNSE